MLAPHLKSKIDQLWNKFWTAGITNPLVAIEQITYLLFLKRLEGLDAERVKYKKRSIYDKEFYKKGEECKWSVIQKERNNVNHLINVVFPWLRNLEEIFRKADALDKNLGAIGNRMSDAYFQLDPYKGAILAEAIQLIDELFSNIDASSVSGDIMGDSFEYLLSEISSAGTNGQFRTPRHIIRMMAEILDPEPGMKCIDPAAGTGGFLFSIISYMLQKYTDKDGIKIEWDGTPHRTIGDRLTKTQDQKLFDGKYYTGFDNDRTMVRIGWMNLILHGIENPQIFQRDSLAKRKESEDVNQRHILGLLESETYHRVAANPPFTGTVDSNDLEKTIFPKAGDKGKKSNDVITNKSELLFVWLMLDLLTVGGRCAVIIPEGVLFGSTEAHTALRRELLMEHQVEGIISLPGGTFQPYTGVKTSILIFQKETKKKDKAGLSDLKNKIPRTESVWFYEVEQECYSLDAKRTERKNQDNDLWDAAAKFKIRNDNQYDELDYYQPKYFTERWRLADDSLLKKFPEEKEVEYRMGNLANISELFNLPGNGNPEIAAEGIGKINIPIIEDLIFSFISNQEPDSDKSVDVLKKEMDSIFKFTKYIANAKEGSIKDLFEKENSLAKSLYEKTVSDCKDKLITQENLKRLKGKKAKFKKEEYVGTAYKIAKEYAKLDGFDVTLRTVESFLQKGKLKTPKSWTAPVRKYAENPDWVSGKLKGSHDSKGNVRTEYVNSIQLYNDAGKLVDELNERERKKFLESIPEAQQAFYNTTLLDPNCIEAKGWNLSAGQYKLPGLSEEEDKTLVSDRIKELRTDVVHIQKRLKKLLKMVG